MLHVLSKLHGGKILLVIHVINPICKDSMGVNMPTCHAHLIYLVSELSFMNPIELHVVDFVWTLY